MSIMSIRVDDDKKKKLKAIASLQGKSMSSIVEALIDRYIEEAGLFEGEGDDIKAIMKASEPSFDEWDNEDDDVYDDL